MLSRIADSMFWLARYMERAEDTARILDVNYHMLLEQSAGPYRLRWEPLIVMAGEQERFNQFYTEANAQTVYEFLAFRNDNPNSIVQCITKARENARTIRDRISREMWEDINGLYHSVSRFDPAEQISSGPHRFCDAVKFGSHRFFGVTDANLSKSEEVMGAGKISIERQRMFTFGDALCGPAGHHVDKSQEHMARGMVWGQR